MAQAKAAKAPVESESCNADSVVKAKLELALTPRYVQRSLKESVRNVN